MLLGCFFVSRFKVIRIDAFKKEERIFFGISYPANNALCSRECFAKMLVKVFGPSLVPRAALAVELGLLPCHPIPKDSFVLFLHCVEVIGKCF